MTRQPSAETQLRTLRADLRRLSAEAAGMAREATDYRRRASKAEAEVAEWKRRFDLLLARTPAHPVGGRMSELSTDPPPPPSAQGRRHPHPPGPRSRGAGEEGGAEGDGQAADVTRLVLVAEVRGKRAALREMARLLTCSHCVWRVHYALSEDPTEAGD